jgi:anti-sigma regulatory factor (Ser/Thr protein kinase)
MPPDLLHETFTVGGGVRAPRVVRELVRPHLEPSLDEDALYDVELLVAEVVTNAVRHGGAGEHSTIEVVLRVDTAGVRLEVMDPGPGFRRPRAPKARATGGGNGFVLLERIADRWGVEQAGGTRVWFHYGLPQQAPHGPRQPSS